MSMPWRWSVSRRSVVAAWLGAILLVSGGCESPHFPFGKQGAVAAPAPAAPTKSAAKPPGKLAQAGESASSPTGAPSITVAPLPLPEGVTLKRPRRQPGEVARVALLAPLSGTNAAIGGDLLNAAQLALFDFAGEGFELLIQDTKGTPEGAADAAQQAVTDGAELILGPLLASEVRAVAPVARQAGIEVLAFSNDRSAAGAGINILGFQPNQDVARVAAFAAGKGIAKFAALAPDNAYGRMVVEALRTTVNNFGGEVIEVAYFDPRATDFNEVIRRLANYEARRRELMNMRKELAARNDDVAKQALKRLEKIETYGDVAYKALLVAEGGKRLQSLAALLPFYDIDPTKVRMLGTGQWDAPGTGAEPALMGGWYAAPVAEERLIFEKRYRDIYGQIPARLATLAYDAVALAAVLARAEGGADFSNKALTNPAGFAGRDGIFRLLADGTNERGLAVMELRGKETRVISPAPTAFPRP